MSPVWQRPRRWPALWLSLLPCFQAPQPKGTPSTCLKRQPGLRPKRGASSPLGGGGSRTGELQSLGPYSPSCCQTVSPKDSPWSHCPRIHSGLVFLRPPHSLASHEQCVNGAKSVPATTPGKGRVPHRGSRASVAPPLRSSKCLDHGASGVSCCLVCSYSSRVEAHRTQTEKAREAARRLSLQNYSTIWPTKYCWPG